MNVLRRVQLARLLLPAALPRRIPPPLCHRLGSSIHDYVSLTAPSRAGIPLTVLAARYAAARDAIKDVVCGR